MIVPPTKPPCSPFRSIRGSRSDSYVIHLQYLNIRIRRKGAVSQNGQSAWNMNNSARMNLGCTLFAISYASMLAISRPTLTTCLRSERRFRTESYLLILSLMESAEQCWSNSASEPSVADYGVERRKPSKRWMRPLLGTRELKIDIAMAISIISRQEI